MSGHYSRGSGSLGNLDQNYKRGAVMGLTVAEAFILLSFILLLLFSWWQIEAEKQQKEAREILGDLTLQEKAALIESKDLVRLVSKQDMKRLVDGLVELPAETRMKLADLVETDRIGRVIEAAADDRIEQATRRLEASASAQRSLVGALEGRLGATIRAAGGEIDGSGTISLPQSVLFDVNDDRIKNPDFLTAFCRPWLDTLRGAGLELSDLKIEGHASSEGPTGSSPETAYLYNLDLSQRRAQNALRICLGGQHDPQAQAWAREHLSAVGYSSARLVRNVAGEEDREASRRVMFSVGVDNRKLIDDIEKDLGSAPASALQVPAPSAAPELASAEADTVSSQAEGFTRTPGEDVVVTGAARVIDGDGLEIGGRRIRIFGIDAPEKDQTCGPMANENYLCGAVVARKLREMVDNQIVECRSRDTDFYGRLLATCSVGGVDVGESLIVAGFAAPFVRYSDRYAAQGDRAKADKVGLWATDFQLPWEFRAEMRNN